MKVKKVYPTLSSDELVLKGISDLVFGQNWCSILLKVYPTLSSDRIGAVKGISDLVFGQNWCSVLLKVYPTCRQTNWCKLRYIRPCLRTELVQEVLKLTFGSYQVWLYLLTYRLRTYYIPIIYRLKLLID